MKKKLFATLLTSVLAVSAITGCSKDASNSEPTENTQNTEDAAKEGDGGAELSAFENRFPGRVSERLFNVWLEHCLEVGNIKADEIREIPFMYMEKINKLNKAYTFLRAKFVGIKPQKSF